MMTTHNQNGRSPHDPRTERGRARRWSTNAEDSKSEESYRTIGRMGSSDEREDERESHWIDRPYRTAESTGYRREARGAVRPIGATPMGPHRGKGPLGYERSDDRIRELVCEALADDDQVDATQIEVSVSDGIVTLSGAVPDRPTKRMAEDAVDRIWGVRDVHNQLEIVQGYRGNRSGPGGVGGNEL